MDINSRLDAYLDATRRASRALKEGKIKAYSTRYCRDRGRIIEVQTDQGWNPDPFYEDYPLEREAETPN